MTVTITLTLLGAEHGQWCDCCALPSAVKVVFALGEGGVATVTVCQDCGRRW